MDRSTLPDKAAAAPPHFASAQKDLPTGKELTQIIFDFLVGGLSRCGSDDNPHPLEEDFFGRASADECGGICR